jgi:hypothetical protein
VLLDTTELSIDAAVAFVLARCEGLAGRTMD